jgi:hypothetical protein
MFVTVGLYLVSFVMAYLAYEMALTAPESPKAKRAWRFWFCICAFIGLLLVIYQYKDTETKDNINATITSGLTNQLNEVTQQNSETKKFKILDGLLYQPRRSSVEKVYQNDRQEPSYGNRHRLYEDVL